MPQEISTFQKTKIVATVGPASESYEMLLSLAQAGVDVFRLNFSHGTQEQHAKVIDRITYINNKYKSHLGILGDLQGPKLRVGKIENEGIEIAEGDVLTFTNTEQLGTKEGGIYMSYESFAQDVTPGEIVLIDDGKLQLKVLETDGESTVKLEVLYGGILKSNKGVNLPQTNISLPSLTEKDRRDLDFMLKQPINWIALSFVRSAQDIIEIKQIIKAADHRAKVIAKIEKPEALQDLDAIIEASDAIMVARGDLGVEVPMEQLPLVQKEIVRKSREMARPVIVATQLMDSMIENPSPTRAEITDVANAVLDGTDAVMLSGETSVGRHPVLVVEAMQRIVAEVEAKGDIYYANNDVHPGSPTPISDSVCRLAVQAAQRTDAQAIIGMTKSGYTGFLVSSFRPKCRVYIFSDQPNILATLNLVWGIRGFYYDKFSSTDDTISDVQDYLKERNFVSTGDVVINTGSMPLRARKRTNMLKIDTID